MKRRFFEKINQSGKKGRQRRKKRVLANGYVEDALNDPFFEVENKKEFLLVGLWLGLGGKNLAKGREQINAVASQKLTIPRGVKRHSMGGKEST